MVAHFKWKSCIIDIYTGFYYVCKHKTEAQGLIFRQQVLRTLIADRFGPVRCADEFLVEIDAASEQPFPLVESSQYAYQF